MKQLYRTITVASVLLMTIHINVSVQAQDKMGDELPVVEGDLIYVVEAANARLIRHIEGKITADIQSVAARPVDNQRHISAQWTDSSGEWTFTQIAFAPPPHPTGLQIGSSAETTMDTGSDPVTTNVYLHGATGAADPILPTVFNLPATWETAPITLNGQPFKNPYDGPAPMWVAHTMTTVGVRNADDTVVTEDGTLYGAEVTGSGTTTDDDLEFHLTFHDAPGPQVPPNFPPLLSFFYHLNFEDVTVEIQHTGDTVSNE
ncbi:MAG: hypothetical protein ACOCYT_03330 [Chloroflexota bacterium]